MLAAAQFDWVPYFVRSVVGVSVLIFWFLIRREKLRMLRNERAKKKICVACGYDMRATPEVCPECGMPAIWGRALPTEFDAAALSANWPADAIEPRNPDVGESPMVFYETLNETEAKLLASQLQARGVFAQAASKRPPVNLKRGATAPSWKVLIWSKDLDAALRVAALFEVRSPTLEEGSKES